MYKKQGRVLLLLSVCTNMTMYFGNVALVIFALHFSLYWNYNVLTIHSTVIVLSFSYRQNRIISHTKFNNSTRCDLAVMGAFTDLFDYILIYKYIGRFIFFAIDPNVVSSVISFMCTLNAFSCFI